MNSFYIKCTGYGVLLWMSAIVFIVAFHATNMRIGPNDELIVMSYHIDTYEKYSLLVLLCVINSGIRYFNHNILHPYMSKSNDIITIDLDSYMFPYQITTICCAYTWFDWYFYINILLAQIDMVLVEAFADTVIGNIVTYYNRNIKKDNLYKELVDDNEYDDI